ncbi:glyoxal reductase [Sporosarcina sp. NCCP-2222]|uniref:aldo/keto reductase n=1 Tax=Sporosarcina sp. NCCP-2222 TaxID=2935073 RepID=UPI00207F0F6A|nr:aldo/keto reductase [Sporosarcina sp. NCCP-2222]GKV57109.1 glyoxal reductase [Sporosarcina sp. NCCP-2222]
MDLIYQEKMTLANGVKMPQLGLGVYKMTDPDQTLAAISYALEIGYRAIDTAAIYENEEETGEAITYSGIPREQLFITSKVWNTDQGYDETLRAFEKSLKKLQLDYLDLYLTHWPVAGKYQDTYKAIERLYEEKLIRATGVSNHHVHHLEEILSTASIPPMVNQVELHPHLSQVPLRTFCKQHGIEVTSWSPLARGRMLADETLGEIGRVHGKTPAQVIIRWHLQNGLIAIPKSVTKERIKENASVADFVLSSEEMQRIDGLNIDARTGTNPEKYDKV